MSRQFRLFRTCLVLLTYFFKPRFVVKLIESSLFAADFLTAHFLLFMLTVPMIIPFVDRLHSTMLCKSCLNC